jgi:hypothetical protein
MALSSICTDYVLVRLCGNRVLTAGARFACSPATAQNLLAPCKLGLIELWLNMGRYGRELYSAPLVATAPSPPVRTTASTTAPHHNSAPAGAPRRSREWYAGSEPQQYLIRPTPLKALRCAVETEHAAARWCSPATWGWVRTGTGNGDIAGPQASTSSKESCCDSRHLSNSHARRPESESLLQRPVASGPRRQAGRRAGRHAQAGTRARAQAGTRAGLPACLPACRQAGRQAGRRCRSHYSRQARLVTCCS